jgi:MFS transporter, putative metabolite:H+ symporter
MTVSEAPFKRSNVWMTVLVCALGYFVDIYDLILFGIVRPNSLADLGLTGEALQSASELIMGWQMAGMLIGGILFGILADRRGRLSILMASIVLYSFMNIANAFVTDVWMYAVLRFFSGIGLAGELGVAITLVSEVMPKHSRGYGTTIVAATGILGAVAAYFVNEIFDWRAAFIAGGLLGFGLLVLRVRVHESGMFRRTERTDVQKGNIFMMLKPHRLVLYISSVAIGLPIWYVIGILVFFSPELTAEGGSSASIVAGQALMWAYVGLAGGDLVSGLISQWIRSRKRTVLLFLLLTTGLVWWYLSTDERSAQMTYLQCGLLGFAAGYWAVFVTTAAEQFGTNLRATVATTVPNFVRGALTPALLVFGALRLGDLPGAEAIAPGQPMLGSAAIVGIATMVIAFVGWSLLKETYGKDLDYHEV